MWGCTKECTSGCTRVAAVVELVDAMHNAQMAHLHLGLKLMVHLRLQLSGTWTCTWCLVCLSVQKSSRNNLIKGELKETLHVALEGGSKITL